MINYICAALCGLCALLLVVILRQRQEIRHLKVENDTLLTLIKVGNDTGRMLAGIVIKLKNRELLKSEEKNDE
jgi:chromosomal replication initiation ATPase DnaA